VITETSLQDDRLAHRTGVIEPHSFENFQNTGNDLIVLSHLTPPSRYWVTTMPSWRGYRIYKVSTMIPMPLRIAYYGLEVKPTKNQHLCCFKA